METIASFAIDHDRLEKGFYVSRVDGDVISYDIRMIKPNSPPYLTLNAAHSFEHLFATYVRNSPQSDQVVYVGPMGCMTGFYFLTRDSLPKQEALDLFREALDFIAHYEGAIPGAEKSAECGNYKAHDLPGAQALARDMQAVLADWQVADMVYPS